VHQQEVAHAVVGEARRHRFLGQLRQTQNTDNGCTAIGWRPTHRLLGPEGELGAHVDVLREDLHLLDEALVGFELRVAALARPG
jgi:hypothetical protein